MEEKKCAVCGDEGIKLCTGCYVIRYCSKEHQKEHWKQHKLHCKTIKEKWNVDAGHHFVASRDLKPGTIILQEDPLVLGALNDDGIAICLGCCRNLDGNGVGCPHCNWPMCGRSNCWAEGSQHAIGECGLLEGAGDRVATSKYALSASTDVYYSILVLRCLSLLERDPPKWDKLMNLKANTSSDYPKSDRAFIVKLVNQWLPEAAVPEEYITKICNAFDFGRSFELSEAVLVDGGEGLKGIYSVTGLFDDSRIPNATASFSQDARMVVRAAVPIAKGARIMVNYARDFRWANSPLKVAQQFQHLGSMNMSSHRKGPTEVNAISSWMYCSTCPDQHGILRPVNPLLATTDWKCDTCFNQMSAKFIAKIMDDAMKDLTRLDRASIPECEAFLSKYRKILHVHHSFIADTKMDIVCNYDQEQLSAMNEETLEKRVTMARELLETYDVISPGLNRLRGYLLYQLYIFLNAQSEKLSSLPLTTSNESKTLSCLKLMAETLKEVVTIFSWESELTLEGRLAEDLRQRLFYVKGFIRAKRL